ncbi:MAG: hypothetical protein PHV11_05215 [Candidatus Bipolaricaulis sp.]|nr:hypothetical protein [Candidatus Bipolaricaulis sp.]
MTRHEKAFSEGVGVTAHLSAQFQEATNLCILDSVMDLLTDGERAGIQNRFGIAIFLTAALIESTASFLLEQLKPGEDLEHIEQSLGLTGRDMDGNHFPKPIRSLIASYYAACGSPCPHQLSGLLDIFQVRNRIVGHPAGTAKEDLDLRDDGSWDRKRADRTLTYDKFRAWPTTLSQFKREHAHEALAETRDVLKAVRDDLERAGVDDRILKRAHPPSLENWMGPE